MNDQITALEAFEKGLTKSEISNMANNAISHVMETGNVLQVAEALSAMESFIKEVKASEQFKSYTRDEASKYPKGFVSSSGAKIELAETGSRYDYSQCNDSLYKEISEELLSAQEALKRRETFLKTIPIEGMEVLLQHGELVKIFPPSKTSTSSYKVTLSK